MEKLLGLGFLRSEAWRARMLAFWSGRGGEGGRVELSPHKSKKQVPVVVGVEGGSKDDSGPQGSFPGAHLSRILSDLAREL